VCLEFAAWTRALDERDVAHDPMTASGARAEGMIVGKTRTLADAASAPAS
jgi:hypothetical protein